MRISRNFATARGTSIDATSHQPLHTMLMKQWNDISQQADTDSNNIVTLEEWLAYWRIILASDNLYEQVVDGLGQSFFMLLDRDGDGTISISEYQEYLKCFEFSKIDAEKTFLHLTDNTGFLGLETARQYGKDFFLGEEADKVGNWLFGPIN